ncbi:MAG: serine--tRNA ligase [Xanthomonadaceae bacterium]|nr:serine--tRNA ligase [Xanthomonadaceae bacterium]
MLDPKYYQESFSELEIGLKKRGFDSKFVSNLSEISKTRKALIQEAEALKSERNQVTAKVAELKSKAKSDPAITKEADAMVLRSREIGDKIKIADAKLKEVEFSLKDLALAIPNLPQESVPVGADLTSNKEVRKWGAPGKFSFEPKDHVALGESLRVLDFERAGKISGARFSLYMGSGASLERALIQFMLDLHTEIHGYTEVIPPFLVSRESMMGTGQLPKFEQDLFKTSVADRDLYLIPTSEVPLTNIHAREILEPNQVPKYFTAYSPCFRSEAGSYGKDTRGLIRLHQFQKVELVKITNQESSLDELEKMVSNAEKVLQMLELPYRVMLLCSGDMGFSATKTYDLEVWLPSSKEYREISSCSNCGDFQARRAEIKYRSAAGEKPKFAHTLNGSGLAVGRTFVAILENHQTESGEIKIPAPLHRYLDGKKGFKKNGNDLYMTRQID